MRTKVRVFDECNMLLKTFEVDLIPHKVISEAEQLVNHQAINLNIGHTTVEYTVHNPTPIFEVLEEMPGFFSALLPNNEALGIDYFNRTIFTQKCYREKPMESVAFL